MPKMVSPGSESYEPISESELLCLELCKPVRVEEPATDSDDPVIKAGDPEEQVARLIVKIKASLEAELSQLIHDHYELKADFLEGTGRWFFDSAQFRDWLDGESKTLVCRGIPGSGKTLLATGVVDLLLLMRSRVTVQPDSGVQRPIGVAFVYYGPMSGWKFHGPLNFMILILSQLVEDLPLSSVIHSGAHWNLSDPPTLNEVADIICAVGMIYRRVYIVVDALDEVFSGYRDADKILACLRQLQDSFGAKVLLTLRDIPDLLSGFQNSDIMEVKAADGDIEAFLDMELSNNTWLRRNDAELLSDELKQAILSYSKGMFSWAVAAIRAFPTYGLDQMRHFVESLKEPTELHLLDGFYKSQVTRFTRQDREDAGPASDAIALVSFAKRPLTLSEMQHALAFDRHRNNEDQGIVHDDIEDFARSLISSCLGFLTIEPETQLVQWAHKSARAFSWKPHSNRRDAFSREWPLMELKDHIAWKCASCLALAQFQSGPCRDDVMLEERLARYPFYKYVCQYWAQHWKYKHDADEDGKTLLDFLGNSQSVSAAYEVWQKTLQGTGTSHVIPQGVTGLHIAAHFNLVLFLRRLLGTETYDATVKDSNGNSPLWWAVTNKSLDAARMLVSEDKGTAHSLVRLGKSELLGVLLKAGYNLNQTGPWGRTLLHDAIIDGRTDIVNSILKSGANIHIMDVHGDTPLKIALQKGQTRLVDVLLDMGAYTRNTTVGQWRKGYSDSQKGVMQLTQQAGRSSIKFLAGDARVDIQSASSTQNKAMSLFVFSSPPDPHWLWKDSPEWLLTHRIQDSPEGSLRTYSAALVFPALQTTALRRKTIFLLPVVRPLVVQWSIVWDGHGRNGSRRLIQVHNLPDMWIPEEMLHMYFQFLKQMRCRWETVCEQGELHLQRCREKILIAKGETPSLTDELLEDAQQWTTLRKWLAQHIKEATRFANEYNRQYNEEQAYEHCRSFLSKLQEEFGRHLDSLDKTSQNLIEIEFNLVTIQEARKSVTMAASMKRLSWITFIFLPATFSASLFGMNVDALQGNPSWKWYMLVGGLCMLLTFAGWLVFKFTTLESWLMSKGKATGEWLQRKGPKEQSANAA